MIKDIYHDIEDDDVDFLEDCPKCKKGYMVPTYGNWHQCSHCGIEAEEDDYGVLWYT